MTIPNDMDPNQNEFEYAGAAGEEDAAAAVLDEYIPEGTDEASDEGLVRPSADPHADNPHPDADGDSSLADSAPRTDSDRPQGSRNDD